MPTTINQALSTTFSHESSSIITRFMNWCKGQEKNRLLWLGVILTGHGCILTPITVFAVVLGGTNIFLFMAAIIAMGITVVTNLAAMPTKATIPVFFFSILLDIAIIISAFAMGLDIAKTYI